MSEKRKRQSFSVQEKYEIIEMVQNKINYNEIMKKLPKIIRLIIIRFCTWNAWILTFWIFNLTLLQYKLLIKSWFQVDKDLWWTTLNLTLSC